MSQLKPYPEFICEDCWEALSSESLKKPDSSSYFKLLGKGPVMSSGEVADAGCYECDACGLEKPIEECASLGYPILQGYELPKWSPEDDDPIYTEVD